MRATLALPAERSSARPWRRLALLVAAAAVLATWLTQTPAGLLGKVDAIGYAVCHRIDLRSFHLGDRPLPLCSRCTGMYLGALLGFGFLALRGRGRAARLPSLPIVLTFGLFGLAFAVDGLNSYLHFFPGAPVLYEPSNVLRLVTGTLLGLGLAVVVYPGFHQTVWRQTLDEPVLRSFGELAVLLGAAGIVIGLVLTENPLILYPLALVSGLGVIVLLTSVYSMVVLLLLRKENQADTWRDLAWPLLGGLTLGFLQISLLDLGRFAVTGTWSGFTL
ncbi:MAG: hypothetical protein A2Y93_06125 [Chloroflexi bacterium RBG_13_68_17]|nr:MAG: hypothetical protein A2Y93_06125 [Chloroflexi bacterium RBG_13_68_17]